MTMPCVAPDELAQYLDGEVSANRATAVRDHVETCSRCRSALDRERRIIAAVAAPLAASRVDLVDRVMRQLEVRPTPAPRRHLVFWAAPLATAATIALVLLVRSTPRPTNAEFQARGATATSSQLSKRVGVTVLAIGSTARSLDDGERVTPSTSYVASVSNLERHRPVYLLAFAIDAGNQVHWLYPAYLDANRDPLALELPHTERTIPLPETVQLEDVARGPLRVITIASFQQLRVSEIERAVPSSLTRAALEVRWPDAVIREVRLEVVAEKARP
ncbi:MAG: anti-sigma factor [Kofleriaceae bacterium]